MIYLKYLVRTKIKKSWSDKQFFSCSAISCCKMGGGGMRGDDERVYSRIKNAFKKMPTLSNIANNNIGVDKKSVHSCS